MLKRITRAARGIALLALLLLSITLQAKEAVLVLTEQQEQYSAGRQLALLQAPLGSLSIEEVRATNSDLEFSPSPSDTPNLGYTSSAVWARLQIYNNSPRTEWWMEVGKAHLQNVTLYHPTPEGGRQALNSGISQPFALRPIKHRGNLFPISIPPGETRTYYLQVWSQTPLMLPVTLWQPEAFSQAIDRDSIIKGALYGVLIGIGLYYLFAALILREVLYLQSSLFLFSYLLYSTAYNGLLHQYISELPGEWSLRLFAFGIASANVFYLAYSRNFLQTHRYSPGWHRCLNLLIGVAAAAALASFWVDYVITDKLVNLLSPLNGISTLAAAFIILFRGYRPARLFVVALLIFWIAVSLRIMGLFGLLPNILGETEMSITLMGVLPMFAVSFADRYNLLRQDKEAAQARALKAEQMTVQTLESKVAERTRELERARQQAETANRAKSEFLATMSHELRTPMTAVLGATQLLDETRQPPDNRHLLNSINTAGQHLLTLIDDVLDLSRVEEGQLVLNDEIFAPENILSETVALLQPVAAERGLTLELETAELPALVRGDPVRLRQILNNLIANAIKYTKEGQITVCAALLEPDAGRLPLHISVEDTGCGIPEEWRSQIFKPFEQVDGSASRHQEGAGLGLAICKRLVEAMDGTIGVESDPGQGSQFWFTVDLQPVSEAEAASKASVPNHKVPDPMRILLVDDTAANREIVGQLLKRDGHQVTIADSGQAAVEATTDALFDLVLMDVQMPGIDGLQATRQIRRHTDPARADMPILALTASTTHEMIQRCLDAGMDGLVGKPLRLQELYNTLAELTDGHHAAHYQPIAEASDLLEDYRRHLSPDELNAFMQHQQQTIAQAETLMRTAWDADDLHTMAQAAHKLSGSAGMAGLTELADIALQLEEAARTADREQLIRLMETYETSRAPITH